MPIAEESEYSAMLHEFEHLTELLNAEIDRIRAEESRPGWTMWALLGGLATILWLMVAELEKNTIDLLNVLFLLLLFSLVCDTLREIPLIISGSPALSVPLRVKFTRSIFQGRVHSLVALVRSITLIIVTAMIRPFASACYVVAAYVFYVRLALAFAGRFLLSFLRVPSPAPQQDAEWTAKVLRLLLLVPGIIALFGLSSALLNQKVSPEVFEYRFSGLLVAATLTLLLLAQGQSRAPLLATLMHIRRSLTFGSIDLASAKRQAEVALLGMTVADAFQDDLRRLLLDLQQADVFLEAIEQRFQEIRSVLDKSDSEISEKQRVLMEAVRRSSQIDLDDAKRELNAFLNRYESFRRRTRLFLGRQSDLTEERDDLLDKLSVMRQEVEKRLGRSKKLLQTLDKTLDSVEAG